MATITPVLRKDKADSKGRCPVYVRLEAGNKRSYVSLGFKVLPSQWNLKSRRVRSSHLDADELNGLIEQQVAQSQREKLRLQLDGQEVSALSLKIAVTDGGSAKADFWIWADRWLDGKRRLGQIQYWRRARAVLRKLRDCLGSPTPWSRLTPNALRRFDLFMAEKLRNRANTRIIAFTVLKTVVRAAVREGIIQPNDNPFERFVLPRSEPIQRAKLTLEQIRAMEALSLRPGSTEAVARDMYVFSFLSRGMRFGDVVRLQWGALRGERIEFVAGKTGDHLSIPVSERIGEILKPYGPRGTDAEFVFPLLRGSRFRDAEHEVGLVASANARVNKALKVVAAKAGVEASVSFHTARHSFAFAAKKAGLNNWEIGDALKQKKSATTDRYLKSLDEGYLDGRVETVFG